MKKLVSIALVFCLMAGLTVYANAEPAKIRLTDHFSFSMTPSEMLQKAEELGLKPKLPEGYSDYSFDEYYDLAEVPKNAVRDGRWYQLGDDDSYVYFFDGMCIDYSRRDKVNHIRVDGDRFETDKGISVGDSKAKVMKEYRRNMGPFITLFAGANTKKGNYVFEFNKQNNLISWGCYKSTPVSYWLSRPFSLIPLIIYYAGFGFLWMPRLKWGNLGIY